RIIGSFSYRGFCDRHHRGTGALYSGTAALNPLTSGFPSLGPFGFGGPCKMPGRRSGLNREMQSPSDSARLQLHGTEGGLVGHQLPLLYHSNTYFSANRFSACRSSRIRSANSDNVSAGTRSALERRKN